MQLKPRLINILMNALQVENDAQNTHMLLGGLLLLVQDAVTFEELEGLTNVDGGRRNSIIRSPSNVNIPNNSNESNLLSSGTGKWFQMPYS